MKSIETIESYISKRIKVYCSNFYSIRGFNTSFRIHECYEPKYICFIGNSVCIGNNGHEVSINELTTKDLIRLFRFIVSGKNR
jgi:hypothetical protein